jgi:hypothetical protein
MAKKMQPSDYQSSEGWELEKKRSKQLLPELALVSRKNNNNRCLTSCSSVVCSGPHKG